MGGIIPDGRPPTADSRQPTADRRPPIPRESIAPEKFIRGKLGDKLADGRPKTADRPA
jgi:hypothetical protein